MTYAGIRSAVRLASRFAADARGSTAIEYGLICALIFLVLVGAAEALGANLINNFWNPAAAAFPH